MGIHHRHAKKRCFKHFRVFLESFQFQKNFVIFTGIGSLVDINVIKKNEILDEIHMVIRHRHAKKSCCEHFRVFQESFQFLKKYVIFTVMGQFLT